MHALGALAGVAHAVLLADESPPTPPSRTVEAVPDEKWHERPLGRRVLRPGAQVNPVEVRGHPEEAGSARRQFPDRVEVIDSPPRTGTGTGKFDKKALRARFGA